MKFMILIILSIFEFVSITVQSEADDAPRMCRKRCGKYLKSFYNYDISDTGIYQDDQRDNEFSEYNDPDKILNTIIKLYQRSDDYGSEEHMDNIESDIIPDIPPEPPMPPPRPTPPYPGYSPLSLTDISYYYKMAERYLLKYARDYVKGKPGNSLSKWKFLKFTQKRDIGTLKRTYQRRKLNDRHIENKLYNILFKTPHYYKIYKNKVDSRILVPRNLFSTLQKYKSTRSPYLLFSYFGYNRG